MPDLRAPTLAEILEAAENIAGKAIRSPLIKFQGDTGGVQAEIWLKLENLQPTGANSQKKPLSSPCLRSLQGASSIKCHRLHPR